MKKNIAVISIGNEFMGDDGIAHAVLNILSKKSPPADLIDGGTGGISLLHIMKGYKKVIFIDSGDFGGEPGEIRVFAPEEVSSIKKMQRYSLHESDLMEIIHLSHEIGETPQYIRIILIQPKNIEMNTSLSPEIAAAIPKVVKEVISQIRKINL